MDIASKCLNIRKSMKLHSNPTANECKQGHEQGMLQ